MGIVNVPFKFCSIYVPFHFYLVMTLVVPCLDNIFMVYGCYEKYDMSKHIILQSSEFVPPYLPVIMEPETCVCPQDTLGDGNFNSDVKVQAAISTK